jgi:Uma2 family endonuclease
LVALPSRMRPPAHSGARPTPLPQAPEICVEVLSPSNTTAEMETRACLGAGAVEVWLVSHQGALRVLDAQGEQPASRYGVTLALR